MNNASGHLTENAEAIISVAKWIAEDETLYNAERVVSRYATFERDARFATDIQLSKFLSSVINIAMNISGDIEFAKLNDLIADTRVRVVRVGETYEIVSVLEFIESPLPAEEETESD
jgi:hypothetical protein